MNYNITKHLIGSDDNPEDFFHAGQHWLTLQSPLPVDLDNVAAYISADVGHEVQPVDMDEHTFYGDPVFNYIHAVWIDTENETVYMMSGAKR